VRDGQPVRLRVVNPANGRFMRLSAPGQQLVQIGGDGGLLDAPRPIPAVGTLTDPVTGLPYSDPDPAQGLQLAPSERADLVLIPQGAPGEVASLEWHDAPVGRHQTFLKPDGSIGFGDAPDDGRRPPVDLLRLEFTRGRGAGWHPRLPLRSAPLQPIPLPAGADRLAVVFGHAAPAANGSVLFFNAVKLDDALLAALDARLAEAEDPAHVGPVPGMIMPPAFMPRPFPVLQPADALHAQVGDVKEWYLVNFTGADHPFHSHGFPFQALEIIQVNLDGLTAAERVVRTPVPLELKDTMPVPARPGAPMRSWTILRAAVRFDDSANPAWLRRTPLQLVASGKVPVTSSPQDPATDTSGGWLAHCHMLDHAAVGMMSFVNLTLP
jgi:FtsP/CotA-like multicopper oxidase with cupredoxin domain